MRLEFTEEEEMLREQVRRLAREKIAPLSAIGEEEESLEIAGQMIRAIGEKGLCALFVPAGYGGVGVKAVNICIVREELSKVSNQADMLYAELGIATYGISLEGSEEQRRKYLPRVAKGEMLASRHARTQQGERLSGQEPGLEVPQGASGGGGSGG